MKSEELVKALDSVLEDVSVAAIWHIGRHGSVEDIAHLADVPRTPKRMEAMIGTVSALGSELGVPLLKELAEQSVDGAIARSAITTLAEVGDASVVGWLKNLSSHRSTVEPAIKQLQSRLTKNQDAMSLTDRQEDAGGLSSVSHEVGAVSEPRID